MISGWILLASVFALSLMFCGVVVWRGPGDAPDGGRKVQARTVATAGGLGIWFAVAAGLWLSGDFVDVVSPDTSITGGQMGAVWIMIGGAAGVGLMDDLIGLSSPLKLVLLAILALIGTVWGAAIETMYIPGLGDVGLPIWASLLGTALWYFVMMNAVNFMDGSNGLVMGSGAIMLVPLVMVLIVAGMFTGTAEGLTLTVFLLLPALAGFLVWNMAGRLYAGDTGALSLGAMIAVVGVVAADGTTVWFSAMIVLPFLVDVFLTLIWRARAGRPLMQAHRDHAYQVFLRAGYRHWQVALVWWGMSAICAVGAWVLPELIGGGVSSFPGFVLLLIVGCALWCWQRVTLGRRLAREGL